MAQTIDPAFQGAPYLGDSSFDPVEFIKGLSASKYKNALASQEQKRKDYEAGLKSLASDKALEVKEWEDRQGSEQILKDKDRVESAYIALSQKGFNLTSPKTQNDAILFRGLQKEIENVKKDVALWDRMKIKYDDIQKRIKDDSQLPVEKQRIDREETIKALDNFMKTPGTISDRAEKMDNLLVYKATAANVSQYFLDNYDKAIDPRMDKKAGNFVYDTTTGKFLKKDFSEIDPKRIKSGVLGLYENIQREPALVGLKKELDRQYAEDPDKGMLSKEEWVLNRFGQPSPVQENKTLSSTGSKGGLELNFLGKKTTMQPGSLQTTPRPYGTGVEGRTYTNYYEFNTSDTYKIPLGAKGSSYFMGQGWMPLENGGDVEGQLLFYDSNRDEFIFRTTQSGVAPFTMNNMTIAVPRKNLGDKVDDLPIEVDGVIKKLKDVYGPGPKMKTIGGLDFRTETKGETATTSGKKSVAGKDLKGTETYIPSNMKR